MLLSGADDAGIIRVLSSEVIDRIAAGEVIERPASVAKELVENAFDAGATQVDVQLEDGGLSRLTVSDDGVGMSRADVARSILRHATSKLRDADDLFNIRSYGFRGEALSSIGAVARMTITTRRPTDDVGTRLVIEGGAVRSIEDAGCPVGTTIDVRDLFYNTPARKKFMRSPATEQAHVAESVLRVLLGNRKGGALVTSGERRLLDVPAGDADEPRIRAALGARAVDLFAFDRTTSGVRVFGYVTRPEVDRADSKGLWFFVNGRYVRDRVLQRALFDGYRSMVESGRYPMAVTYIEVPPSVVDVNVHPQKLEVRFSDGNAVYRALSAALAETLAKTPWVQAHKPPTPSRLTSYVAEASPLSSYLPLAPPPIEQVPLPTVNEGGYFTRLRPLGQALGLFLVCEGDDELVVIDQHAAHERVAFERLRGQAAIGEVERQQLLFPEVLELAPSLLGVLEERWESLRRYGFEVEPVGPSRFAVRAVPAVLRGADAKQLVHDLLDELLTVDAGASVAADAQARLLSRCACHAVVRAGDELGKDEIRALLRALDDVDFGANCPHGRPVYRAMSKGELERLFHR